MPPFATLTAQTLTRPVVDVEFSISIRQENNWATAQRGKAVGAVFFFFAGEGRRQGFTARKSTRSSGYHRAKQPGCHFSLVVYTFRKKVQKSKTFWVGGDRCSSLHCCPLAMYLQNIKPCCYSWAGKCDRNRFATFHNLLHIGDQAGGFGWGG